MRSGLIQQTIELLQAVNPGLDINKAEAIAKAWTQSGSATTGITYYDLEAPSKKLYPVITPLRNRIPRVSGKGGIQANWKAVTGINTSNMAIGVGEGNRSGVINTSTVDKNAVYRSVGLEDYVTWEEDYSAEGFEDVKALATEGLLRAVMIGEEKVILGGNGSDGVALGTTPTPSLTGSTSGGSLATQTLSVICVALSFEGYSWGSIAGGIFGQISRTNADGSTDNYGGGSAQKSANATVSITGPNGSCGCTVTPVNGAVAYAWFWATAGAEVLGAITTINSVVITAAATGTQTAASLAASDQSKNTLEWTGLLYQCFASGSNAQVAAQATGTAGTGTPLTSDGAGGIVELDADMRAFWDNYRLSPTDIYVSSQEQLNISKKVLANAGGTGAQRFIFNENHGAIGGGMMVKSYLNKFAMDGALEIPIHLHPNVPPGTILYFCDKLPYPLSNVTNVVQMRMRRDYFAITWPEKTRKWEYGVYANGVLQNYFPPAFGVRSNIANG